MSNPTLLRSETTPSASKPGASAPHGPDHPEQPYQTKKGCLIMIAVFGGLIALTIATMLLTGVLSGK